MPSNSYVALFAVSPSKTGRPRRASRSRHPIRPQRVRGLRGTLERAAGTPSDLRVNAVMFPDFYTPAATNAATRGA